jgi:hypothetical protein
MVKQIHQQKIPGENCPAGISVTLIIYNGYPHVANQVNSNVKNEPHTKQ